MHNRDLDIELVFDELLSCQERLGLPLLQKVLLEQIVFERL